LQLVGAGQAGRHAGSLPPSRDVEWSIFMARAQAGDGHAYNRLLTEITPYLRTLAGRHCRAPQEVEDAVQDILLTIHSVRHIYDPARPFMPWLVTIARRRIIDRLRQQGRTRTYETPLEEDHETIADTGANIAESRSDGRALRAAVETLPPGQRGAITLLKFEELSLKEASQRSGLSVAALKVATRRAVKSLRALLARDDAP
jgi:RNA polymerase sigma-70 factor (ECF subfamily)